MKFIPRVLLCFAVAALGAAVPPLVQAQGAPAPRHIDVAGEGEVRAAPDQVVVTLGVESWAVDLAAARKDNADRMARLMAVPLKYGVAPKDVSTDFAAIEPQYDNSSQTQVRAIAGYRVTNLLSVRLTDLTKAGPLVTEALTAGANRLDGVSFGLADPSALRAQTRVLAAKDAQAKAQSLATALGQSLGKPLAVSESSLAPYPAPRFKAMAVMDEAGSAPGESFSPGQVLVSAQVSVSYELVDR